MRRAPCVAAAIWPTKLSGKGKPTSASLGGNASNAITLIAGPTCATATLPCALVHGGKARRCKLPPH